MTMTSRSEQDTRQYAVDERLVMPGTRYEVIGGEVVYVPPADPPHATAHSRIYALLEAHVASSFTAASDMLTRTSLRKLKLEALLSRLETTRYALPVCVLVYRYDGKAYRSLIHGQDQRVVLGRAPLS